MKLSQLRALKRAVVPLAADPTVTSALAAQGQLGSFGGCLYIHFADGEDTGWLNLTTLGYQSVLRDSTVYSHTFTVGYTQFVALGHVQTGYIDLTDWVFPPGAKWVNSAYKVRTGNQFAASGMISAMMSVGDGGSGGPEKYQKQFNAATIANSFQTNGTAYVGADMVAAIRVTLIVLGCYLDNLTAGSVDITLQFRIEDWPPFTP